MSMIKAGVVMVLLVALTSGFLAWGLVSIEDTITQDEVSWPVVNLPAGEVLCFTGLHEDDSFGCILRTTLVDVLSVGKVGIWIFWSGH